MRGEAELATLVRDRRLALRLTQRQAAARAGVSLATWQSLERRGASAEQFQHLTLARVAHGLDVTVQHLQGGETAAIAARNGEGPAPDGAAGPDVTEQLIDELAEQLRALAARSDETFRVVHGQASDAAAHFLRVLPD